jgi:hypothetical protein
MSFSDEKDDNILHLNDSLGDLREALVAIDNAKCHLTLAVPARKEEFEKTLNTARETVVIVLKEVKTKLYGALYDEDE